MEKAISIQALQRLPMYLTFLRTLEERGGRTVSAKQVAEALGLGEIQVRKDLASVSGGGRPKIGYVTRDLITDIEAYLGYHEVNDAIIVGAGKLGSALLGFGGFADYGITLRRAFDNNPAKLSDEVLPLDSLPSYCSLHQVEIGIITTPPAAAQEVADLLVRSGVRAIWCFSAVRLNVPESVTVQYENMAPSLAHLHQKVKITHSN